MTCAALTSVLAESPPPQVKPDDARALAAVYQNRLLTSAAAHDIAAQRAQGDVAGLRASIVQRLHAPATQASELKDALAMFRNCAALPMFEAADARKASAK